MAPNKKKSPQQDEGPPEKRSKQESDVSIFKCLYFTSFSWNRVSYCHSFLYQFDYIYRLSPSTAPNVTNSWLEICRRTCTSASSAKNASVGAISAKSMNQLARESSTRQIPSLVQYAFSKCTSKDGYATLRRSTQMSIRAPTGQGENGLTRKESRGPKDQSHRWNLFLIPVILNQLSKFSLRLVF